jgi:N-acetyltransferase 10
LTFGSSDSRIPALIRNGLQEKKRSFFVVVGDRAKDAIVHRTLLLEILATIHEERTGLFQPLASL